MKKRGGASSTMTRSSWRCSAAVLLTSVVSASAPALTHAAPSTSAPASASRHLKFEQVFGEVGEPKTLHFRADYVSRGAAHKLEVWRDGTERLVRRTDDAIEIHADRVAGSPAYRMIVLDLQRKIETRVARDDMYRIGNFTEWFDLAHGLRYPKGSYRLTATAAPEHGPTTIGACRWYLLEQGASMTRVCWSPREHLPLLLMDDRGSVLWQVSEISHAAQPESVFLVRDEGFVRNDASQDISGD